MIWIPDLGWAIAHFAFQLVAALGCLIAAVWLLRKGDRNRPDRVPTIVALALTVAWCVATAALGQDASPGILLAIMRDVALIHVVYRLFEADGRHRNLKPVRPLVGALYLVMGLQILLLVAGVRLVASPLSVELIFTVRTLLHLLVAIGVLVLLHNLYAAASSATRQSLRWSAGALAAIWIYELNLHTVAYLGGALPTELVTIRGLVLAFAALALALGLNRDMRSLRLRPSRAMAFRSLSLVVIGGYLLLMLAIAGSLDRFGGDFGRLTQVGFLFAALALALYWLPSPRLRSALRVAIAKHLFQHRYDYREEWLRFSSTIGDAGGGTFEKRVVQALADITDSPSGMLLLPSDVGSFAIAASWRWDRGSTAGREVPAGLVSLMERERFIVSLDDARAGIDRHGEVALVPDWLRADDIAWALVPLMHFDRLTGLVLLAKPPIDRRLDWEDFDLLKVAGQQLGSYLAEQATQQALMESARFDEFNRRMAFVMHDIKNLASQLALLARNAELHAERADFRADMLVTLRSSSAKLNSLLSRLGRYGSNGRREARPVDLAAVCRAVANKFADRRVEFLGTGAVLAMADEGMLEQSLDHLVQNAVDASDPALPVVIELSASTSAAHIQIVDSGTGMSQDFLLRGLFKPFVSSKQDGFGIGAFEAREHIRAMGGRLDVDSREGLGSRFAISLPLAGQAGDARRRDESSQEAA